MSDTANDSNDDSIKEYVKHHYSLIASAVGGRAIPIHWHENESFDAYSDNRSIFVPATDTARTHVFDVIAQALLMRIESFKRKHIQRLVGKRDLANRYLYAELVRGAREYSHILPRSFCEHPTIEKFPHNSCSADDSFTLASSQAKFPDFPEFLGTLRTILVLKTTIPDEAYAALTKRQQQGQFEMKDIAELSEEDQDDAEESKILKLFQNPMFSGGKMADILNDILGAGRSGKPEDDPNSGSGAEMPVGSVGHVKKKGLFATLTDMAFDLVVSSDRDDAGSKAYPEWDYAKNKYRKDWVLVDELDPWTEEPESNELLNTLLQRPPSALKRKLAGVGLSYETHRNQLDGEDYTLDRVVDYFVDLNMGSTTHDRLYERNMKTRRDLATMLLLDISGSTAEKEAGGYSIHHKQMQLAYHLMCALHELGDQVALYGFHSWGRTLVRLLRLKSFKEHSIGSRIYNRFAQLEPIGYTRTGGALRHAAKKLLEETRLPYRILIVITDGFAYDQDYEGKYGEEDTKKALEEIRAGGTGCLCITIGSDQDEEKLKNVFGAASTLSARDYDDFINNIRPALLRAVSQIKTL